MNSGTGHRKYDCLVPISGGKDSTFILYYAVRELKLSSLAVTYDSGFQTELAKQNILNATSILGVPLITVKSPGDLQSKLLRESLLISKKVGYLTQYCGNCEAIIRSVSINSAKKHGIAFILWGSSALETISNQDYENYRKIGTRNSSKSNNLMVTAKTKWNALVKDPSKIRRLPKVIYPFVGYHSLKYKIFSIAQRVFLQFPFRYAIRPNSVPPFSEKDPAFVHFFDYIPWDSIRNITLLKEILKWEHPGDRITRFDCGIHCLGNYDYLKRYGISHDGVNFCNFIRENRMSREEVMIRENEIINKINEECGNLTSAKKLGNSFLSKIPNIM
jgi:hypothetical protein